MRANHRQRAVQSDGPGSAGMIAKGMGRTQRDSRGDSAPMSFAPNLHHQHATAGKTEETDDEGMESTGVGVPQSLACRGARTASGIHIQNLEIKY